LKAHAVGLSVISVVLKRADEIDIFTIAERLSVERKIDVDRADMGHVIRFEQ